MRDSAAVPREDNFARKAKLISMVLSLLKTRVAFRLVNLAFAFIFVASAVIQHNRSVGVLWAAIYLAGGSAVPRTNRLDFCP